MIQSTIAAPHKAAQRAALADPLPGRKIAPVPGQAGEDRVVVWQGGGGDLVPSRAPRQDGSPEHLGVLDAREVAVAQSHDVERHVVEIPKIDFGWYERVHQRPFDVDPARRAR